VKPNTLPRAYHRNYVAQKMGKTLKYRRRNELGHITGCATEEKCSTVIAQNTVVMQRLERALDR